MNVDITIIGSAIVIYITSLWLVHIFTAKKYNKMIEHHKTVSEAINKSILEREQAEISCKEAIEKLNKTQEKLKKNSMKLMLKPKTCKFLGITPTVSLSS